MAVNNGSDIWVKAATLVNGMTTKTLDLERDEIDITTQDSGNDFKEFMTGEKSGVATFEGLDDESHTFAYNSLFDAWDTGAAIPVVYGKGVKTTGGRVISANGIITKLSHTGPKNAPVGFSCTVRLTGTITRATSTTTVA